MANMIPSSDSLKAQSKRARTINRGKKTRIRSLQYGPTEKNEANNIISLNRR